MNYIDSQKNSIDDELTKQLNELNLLSDNEFSKIISKKKVRRRKVRKKKYIVEMEKIKFDDKTEVYYKSMRKVGEDPIICEIVEEKRSFKYYKQWDPYTGIPLEDDDPNGPLVFDVDTLIHYWYTSRLNNLWVNPVDEEGGYYQGYYDVGIGYGKIFCS